MKAASLLVAMTFVFLAGCRHMTEQEKAAEVAREIAAEQARARACKSNSLVLLPFSTEMALVEEDEYRHLVKEIAEEVSLGLRDRVGELQKFDRVMVAAECASGVRVESRVVSLIHKSRKFHFKVAGRIIECGAERPLRAFELEQVSKDVASIAGGLASEITRAIDDDDICSALAGEDRR